MHENKNETHEDEDFQKELKEIREKMHLAYFGKYDEFKDDPTGSSQTPILQQGRNSITTEKENQILDCPKPRVSYQTNLHSSSSSEIDKLERKLSSSSISSVVYSGEMEAEIEPAIGAHINASSKPFTVSEAIEKIINCPAEALLSEIPAGDISNC